MSRRLLIRMLATLVVVLALVALVSGLTGSSGPGTTTLVGYFADASPLDPGSQVRLRGVRVGSVRDIELDHGRARVTFDVDRSVLPLHADATMVIRPVNLLGENYVELHPGTDSKSWTRSTTIPQARTSTRVSFEDLLNTLDDPTSTALAALLTTLGEGMSGSGSNAAAALRALAPAMDDTGRLTKILAQQNAVLGALVDQTDPVAGALATRDGRVLDQVVEQSERLLRATAVNRAALDQTLAELPATLSSARRTLANLARTADAAAPMLRGLRPITDHLPMFTRELRSFAEAADPALGSLVPVLRRADNLLDQAAPVVRDLSRSGADLRTVAGRTRTLSDVALDRHLGDLMAFVKKWALATNGRDALGNYFRGAMWMTPEVLAGLGQDGAAPTRSGVGHEPSTSPPGLPQLPQLPQLPDLPGLTGLVGTGTATDHQSATGLTQPQELSLLDQLLGGS